MVRVGLISLAHMHGISYANALKSIPYAELVGIYDRDGQRRDKYAKEFGVKSFSDLESLLKEVDAVIICSENSLHAEYTIKSAQAGKHVLCEKPLASNLADAEKMVEVCKENNVILQTAFPIRFSTPVVRAKEIIDSGAIGEILAIAGTNHGKMPPGWFLDKELAGGGAVFDHTVHVVDIMRWYLNSEVAQVYAEVDTLLHDVDIDDAGMLTMEFENGVIATLDPCWSRPKTFPTWGDVTMKIVGTKGTLAVDAFAQTGEVFSDVVGHSQYNFWGDDADQAMVKDFIDCIVEKRPPRASGVDGMRATEVALAAYESANQVKPVKLR